MSFLVLVGVIYLIKGVFGLPRSGKTTYLAKLAYKAQKKGIKVYTNFYCKGCYTLDFDSLGVYDYPHLPTPLII